MAVTFTDYLFSAPSPGAALVATQNTWVRLVNNATSTAYVSTGATNSTGAYTVAGVPAGGYTLYTGPSSSGPWTTSGDANYNVSDPGTFAPAATYGPPATGAVGQVFTDASNIAYLCVQASPVVWVLFDSMWENRVDTLVGTIIPSTSISIATSTFCALQASVQSTGVDPIVVFGEIDAINGQATAGAGLIFSIMDVTAGAPGTDEITRVVFPVNTILGERVAFTSMPLTPPAGLRTYAVYGWQSSAMTGTSNIASNAAQGRTSWIGTKRV